jgi:hypothetical protein
MAKHQRGIQLARPTICIYLEHIDGLVGCEARQRRAICIQPFDVAAILLDVPILELSKLVIRIIIRFL